MNEEKKPRGFQPKVIEDPTVFTICREELIGDETLTDRATKLLQALKIKYKNTGYYIQDVFEGLNIKLKQMIYGGQVIEVSESTLDSVKKFLTSTNKKLGSVDEPEAEEVVKEEIPAAPFLVKRKM